MKKTSTKKKPLVVAPQTVRVLTTELESVVGGEGIKTICSEPMSGCNRIVE